MKVDAFLDRVAVGNQAPLTDACRTWCALDGCEVCLEHHSPQVQAMILAERAKGVVR